MCHRASLVFTLILLPRVMAVSFIPMAILLQSSRPGLLCSHLKKKADANLASTHSIRGSAYTKNRIQKLII